VEHVVADLSDHEDQLPEPEEHGADAASDATSAPVVRVEPASAQIASGAALCLGGRTPLDQAACAILAQLLERRNVTTRLAGPQALTTSGIFGLSADGISAICVFYLDHRSLAGVRYSVRRLRKKFPGAPIAVCLWGGVELSAIAEAAQADATIGTLREAADFLATPARPLLPVADRGNTGIRLAAG
jgi:hypothetical protein